MNRVCDLSEISTVITDMRPGKDYLDIFKKNNIELLF